MWLQIHRYEEDEEEDDVHANTIYKIVSFLVFGWGGGRGGGKKKLHARSIFVLSLLRVVLPAPKKPVMIVTGVLPSLAMYLFSGVVVRW